MKNKNVPITEELHRTYKAHALKMDITLIELVELALREYLKNSLEAPGQTRMKW